MLMRPRTLSGPLEELKSPKKGSWLRTFFGSYYRALRAIAHVKAFDLWSIPSLLPLSLFQSLVRPGYVQPTGA